MNLKTLKRTMRTYDFRPKKRLGQNFLIDPSFAERMAEIFGDHKGTLVEIGGGFGTLTEVLSVRCKTLFVLEPDPILHQHLLEVFREREGVKIEKKNVLKISFQDYLEPQEHRLSVIGNLPYAITSPILIHLVRERAFLSEAVVTMQREVSERLRAKPRTKSYSSFTCLLQCFADIEPKFRIPRNVFYPQPNVESEVVRLRFLAKPRVSPKDLDFMIRIIRTGFGKRRKMLSSALQDLGKAYPRERLLASLEEAGLSRNARAEELGLEDFARLSDRLRP